MQSIHTKYDLLINDLYADIGISYEDYLFIVSYISKADTTYFWLTHSRHELVTQKHKSKIKELTKYDTFKKAKAHYELFNQFKKTARKKYSALFQVVISIVFLCWMYNPFHIPHQILVIYQSMTTSFLLSLLISQYPSDDKIRHMMVEEDDSKVTNDLLRPSDIDFNKYTANNAEDTEYVQSKRK